MRRTISVTVNRGVPSTLNTPALEEEFMYDLRHDSLEAQALGAIQDHAQNTSSPTDLQLELIAAFQREEPRFFSSGALRRFANGGPPPTLPKGVTESERRGRRMFVDAPFTPGSTDGICALCHGGPMLNTTNGPLSDSLGVPPLRDITVLVSEINAIGNPPITFLVDTDGQGTMVEVTTPDPGELLSETRLPPPFIFPRAFFANFFKINSLWGIRKTAPYFHDNSAKTLADVANHYQIFFRNNPFGLIVELTEQDKADIVAFLRLL